MLLPMVEPSCLVGTQHYCHPRSRYEIPQAGGSLRETKEGRLGHLRAGYLVSRR